MNELWQRVLRAIEPLGLWTLVMRWQRWRGLTPAQRYLDSVRVETRGR